MWKTLVFVSLLIASPPIVHSDVPSNAQLEYLQFEVAKIGACQATFDASALLVTTSHANMVAGNQPISKEIQDSFDKHIKVMASNDKVFESWFLGSKAIKAGSLGTTIEALMEIKDAAYVDQMARYLIAMDQPEDEEYAASVKRANSLLKVVRSCISWWRVQAKGAFI